MTFKNVYLITLIFLISFSIFGFDETQNNRYIKFKNKVDNNEDLSFAVIGGSITRGYASTNLNTKSWAVLTKKWLSTKTQGDIKFLNAGVSGTDSSIAAHRVKNQLAPVNPNFVIIEFAVNDQWLTPEVSLEAYEGTLRQILDLPSKPAVMLLLLCQRGQEGTKLEKEYLKIAEKYNIPALSFGKKMKENIEQGLNTWDDAFETDEIHPINGGHSIIASMISESLENIFKNLSNVKVTGEEKFPEYKGHFANTHYYGNEDLKPIINTGWENDSNVHDEWKKLGGAKKGWKSSKDNAELVFEVETTKDANIGIFYSENDQYRNAKVWIDNESPSELASYASYRNGYLGWVYKVVAKNITQGKHLLHIKMNNDGSGKITEILNVMVEEK